jgi:ABC-type multidrug transport system fused ATPase/permease subunit
MDHMRYFYRRVFELFYSLIPARPCFTLTEVLITALFLCASSILNNSYISLTFCYFYLYHFVCLAFLIKSLQTGLDDVRLTWKTYKSNQRRKRKKMNAKLAELMSRYPPRNPYMNYRRRNRRLIRNHVYESQSGSFMSKFNDLSALVSTDSRDFDKRSKLELERLFVLFSALYQAPNAQLALSSIYLYLSKFLDEALTDKAYQLIVATVNEDSPQGMSDWLDSFKAAHRNWNLVKENEGFQKVSKLVSLLVGAGLISATNLSVDVGGLQLFSELSIPKHVSAFDLADAVMSSVAFFVEGAYACVLNGNLSPLMFGEQAMINFDDNYMLCMQHVDFARPGNLEFIDTTENELDELFETSIEMGKSLLRTTRGTAVRRHVQDRIVRLQETHSTFRQSRQTGTQRIKTFGIGLYGKSGVGKSTLGNILMATTLKYNKQPCTDKYTTVITDRSEFWDNYKSYMTGVFLDDVGNTKAEFVKKPATTIMLEVLNNVKMTANMADLNLKGRVSVQPYVMVTTKNVKDSGATTTSNEPASITRREEVLLTVEVKPEFATNNMLDSSKVRSHFGAYCALSDIWSIDAQISYPIPNPIKGRPDSIGWSYVKFGGEMLKGVSVHTIIKYINQISKTHFEEQKELLTANTNIVEKIEFCENCDAPTASCNCNSANQTIEYEVVATVDKTAANPRAFGRGPPINALQDKKFRADPHEPRVYKNEYEKYSSCITRQNCVLGNDNPNLQEPISEAEFNLLVSKGTPPDYHDFECQAGEDPDDSDDEDEPFFPAPLRSASFMPFLSNWVRSTGEDKVESLVERLDYILGNPYLQWVNLLPNRYFSNKYVQLFIAWHYGKISKTMCFTYFALALCCSALVGHFTPLKVIGYLLIIFGVIAYLYYTEVDLLLSCIRDERVGIKMYKISISHHVKYITGGCILLATLYGLCKSMQQVRPMMAQGLMHPTSMAELEEIDKKDLTATIGDEQNWSNFFSEKLPVSVKSGTTTPAELTNLVKKNLAFMRYEKKGCDIFFVGSNIALMPEHAFEEREMFVTITKRAGYSFKCYISAHTSYRIPDTDLVLVWIPNGGDWKDLSDYFPQEAPKSDIITHFSWRASSGNFLESVQHITPCPTKNSFKRFLGAKYILKFNTFMGLCMGVHVAEVVSPYIAGFHLGGDTGKPTGCSGTLIREQLDDAIYHLKRCSILLAKSSGTLPDTKYDVKYIESQDIHPNSPVTKLTVDEEGVGPNITIYGSCKGRVTYYSDVVTSHISRTVTKVCGVANKWGKPKFRDIDPWQASLDHSSKPSSGLPGDLLHRAFTDYMEPFHDLFSAGKYADTTFHALREATKPLGKMETLAGIDGKKFVDKLPPSTSIGFPLSGPKKDYLEYLDPSLFEEFQCPVELDAIFWTEFETALEAYKKGERYYPVFKACLKDEPTLREKDKVRVFQAAPVVLQLLTRMYFLPIVRILSLFPGISECAVGVNCMGPDWHDLAEHIKKFGDGRILAGDYSKYDLRMPAQIMFVVFKIFLEIAKLCNYPEEAITIMEGIATDICYPIMAYNGDLIQHYGSNPSGHNLTVYVNSVANSLFFRSAFFDRNQRDENYERLNFKSVCCLMTYGDDAKSSVKEGFDWFNHIYVAEFLAKHDMKFTMPDKTSTPTNFMNDADADFLKRKNVWNVDLSRYMGALDEDSIFKSLHSNLKSKVNTREVAAAENIDGALREWFNHGRDVYEKRRAEMKLVAETTNITDMCKLLDSDYDERLDSWKERYQKEPDAQFGDYDFPCSEELYVYTDSIYQPCNGHDPVALPWEYPKTIICISAVLMSYFHYLLFFGKIGLGKWSDVSSFFTYNRKTWIACFIIFYDIYGWFGLVMFFCTFIDVIIGQAIIHYFYIILCSSLWPDRMYDRYGIDRPLSEYFWHFYYTYEYWCHKALIYLPLAFLTFKLEMWWKSPS